MHSTPLCTLCSKHRKNSLTSGNKSLCYICLLAAWQTRALKVLHSLPCPSKCYSNDPTLCAHALQSTGAVGDAV